jgi:hypothetical protein
LLSSPAHCRRHVQQNPWLSVANKQMELMHRLMAEIGLTPAVRSRIEAEAEAEEQPEGLQVTFHTIYEQRDGSYRCPEGNPIPDHDRHENGNYVPTIESRL